MEVLLQRDVLAHLFSNFHLYDIGGFSLVCKTWRGVVYNLSEDTADFSGTNELSDTKIIQTLSQKRFVSIKKLIFGHPIHHKIPRSLNINVILLETPVSLLSSLHTLDLTNCRRLTDEGLQTIATRCKSLKELNVDRCRLITNTGANCVAGLEVLSLCGCSKVSHLNDFPLVELNLSFCERFNFALFDTMVQLTQTLESIDLSSTLVKDNCIETLYSKYPHLTTYKLENCKELSPKLLFMFLNSKNKFKLDFSRCADFTNEAIEVLIPKDYEPNVTHIQSLNLKYCNLSSSTIEKLDLQKINDFTI